jgi:hypothetical protein
MIKNLRQRYPATTSVKLLTPPPSRHDRRRLPSTAPSERHSAPDIGGLEVHGTLGACRISGAGHRLISSEPSVGRGVTWQPGGFWFR